ncbi:cysteine proteinase 5 precursor [Heterostelium album PN500]|uniref:Cysteine proteinase 5 n=1 Tax=Heterostelium pallidum (strain ATCC 26659 / Pp 5 / PN500) TaxID=670386 RepID=D3BUN6_HETP5|nr:cysteine proteinase 5 precursor [Heterostelium album PN500]EFA74824.1 cysteine proteinase 5 precursor [Heterostelium album PN500]|eukprot:XP_020426958.1 cysteine proteinase 5 precursor [Heterostelium album PN500]
MIHHDRQYTAQEFGTRFNIFKKNMDFVHKWNAKGSSTVLGLNSMADISNEEYQRVYLGTHIDASQFRQQAASHKLGRTFKVQAANVDWRAKGAVTPIKNQGQCGSCWSFSTTGSTEGAHFIKTGNLVSLSEQNLMDCSKPEGNQGCNGGLMTAAFEYIIKNNGIDTESSYPYKAEDGKKCLYNPANSAATLSSYVNVTTGSESDLAVKSGLGPVSVAIDASHNSFQLYSSGVYYEPKCSQTQLDHGVLVVGYGSDALPSAGVSAGSGDWWIVKNSWGTTWGVEGYIYMSRNRNNNCGIATMASLPSA